MRAGFRFLLCGAIVVLLTAPVPAQAPDKGAVGGFVTGIEDLPLMAGLTEDPGAGLVFDKPAGRIVEAYATGAPSRSEVIAFYTEILPELGWRRVGDMAFAREGEVLRIGVSGGNGASTVRFSLAPR